MQWKKPKATLVILFFMMVFLFCVCVRKTTRHVGWIEVLPASKQENPDNSSCHFVQARSGKPKEQRCYPLLINYADRCCKFAQENNCKTGLKNGVRQCVSWNKTIFDDDAGFIQRNQHILNRNRGAGYWLWKPYVIYRELYLARDGDIIMYSDTAVNIIGNIKQLIQFTAIQDVIVFQLKFWQEAQWTKRDTFILMNADKLEYIHTKPNLASYILLKKSFLSMAFVSQWLTYAQDRRAITDDANELGGSNYKDFQDHRHDQSILSLLAKKWNLSTYPDPSQSDEGQNRLYSSVFDHHRIRL